VISVLVLLAPTAGDLPTSTQALWLAFSGLVLTQAAGLAGTVISSRAANRGRDAAETAAHNTEPLGLLADQVSAVRTAVEVLTARFTDHISQHPQNRE
jgi:hypothetical protein